MRQGLGALCLVSATLLGGCDDECLPRARLSHAEAGSRDFCVDLAETEQQRRQGLVGVPESHTRGLVLIFPVTGEVCITNKDVGLPIDTYFIHDDGRVDQPAFSFAADDAHVECRPQTRYVLELPRDSFHPGAQRFELIR